MRAPNTLLKRVITVILAFLICANSFIAPRRAHAEVATATLVVGGIVTAAAGYAAYATIDDAANSTGFSIDDLKASSALSQLFYAATGTPNPQLATQIQHFQAQLSLLNGMKANSAAWAQWQKVKASAQTFLGHTWFDFSHLGNFYVSSLDAGSSVSGFRGGTVTLGFMDSYQKSHLNDYFDGVATDSKWAAMGVTGASIISGAIGDVFIEQSSYNPASLTATVHGYCTIHNVTFDLSAHEFANGTLSISSSHLYSTTHILPETVAQSYANDLSVKAGEYVDTANPDMYPKKVVIPPFWYGLTHGEVTDPVHDNTTGSSATTGGADGVVDNVIDGLQSIYGAIKNLGAVIANALEPLFSKLTEFFSYFLDEITGSLQDIQKQLETIPQTLSDIKDGILSFPQTVGNAVQDALETIPQSLIDIKDGILSFPQTVGNAVQDALEIFPDILSGIKSTIIEKADLIGSTLTDIYTDVHNIGAVIGNAITSVIDWALDTIIAGINAISTTLTNIFDWAHSLVDSIATTLEDVLTDLFVPTISLESETTQVKDILETRFPFGVVNWFTLQNQANSGSLSADLTFYNGQYGSLIRPFDFLAHKEKYQNQLSLIWTAFIYGLGVVALYKMLKPKVTV